MRTRRSKFKEAPPPKKTQKSKAKELDKKAFVAEASGSRITRAGSRKVKSPQVLDSDQDDQERSNSTPGPSTLGQPNELVSTTSPRSEPDQYCTDSSQSSSIGMSPGLDTGFSSGAGLSNYIAGNRSNTPDSDSMRTTTNRSGSMSMAKEKSDPFGARPASLESANSSTNLQGGGNQDNMSSAAREMFSAFAASDMDYLSGSSRDEQNKRLEIAQIKDKLKGLSDLQIEAIKSKKFMIAQELQFKINDEDQKIQKLQEELALMIVPCSSKKKVPTMSRTSQQPSHIAENRSTTPDIDSMMTTTNRSGSMSPQSNVMANDDTFSDTDPDTLDQLGDIENDGANDNITTENAPVTNTANDSATANGENIFGYKCLYLSHYANLVQYDLQHWQLNIFVL